MFFLHCHLRDLTGLWQKKDNQNVRGGRGSKGGKTRITKHTDYVIGGTGEVKGTYLLSSTHHRALVERNKALLCIVYIK